MIRKILFVTLLIAVLPKAKATHLVGGDITHEFLDKTADGNSRYRITVNILRDCENGIPTDDEIQIGIYLNDVPKSRTEIVSVQRIGLQKVSDLNACYTLPESLCYEKAIYETIITLRPYTEGYHITYERCCRTNSNNLVQTQNGGQPSQSFLLHTYIYSELPNSSASFDAYQFISPINDTTRFYPNAIDKDGDSVVIKSIRPFSSIVTGSTIPTPAASISFQTVDYLPGHSSSVPFGGNSLLRNDGEYFTMLITNPGAYYISFSVEEYRDGRLMTERNIDFYVIALELPEAAKSSNNIPARLQGLNASNLAASLSWENCVGEVDKYEVYRQRIGESTFSYIDESTTNQYTDQTVDANEDYRYFVKGISNSANPSGNSDTVTVRFKTANVKKIITPEYTLYPNPTSTVLHIEAKEAIAKIKIRNINGQLVFTQSHLQNSKHTLSVETLSLGIYFVEMYISSQRHVCRLFVE